ncbi:MAG: AraC family transcriptional regulator [Planctomycetota bacterium]|nr:MAG: AraC family transcriptional regulator [Planctomycetota bacterium]
MDYPVTVLWVARFAYHNGEVVQQHTHDFAQLMLVLKGRGQWLLDNAQEPLRAGQCCCLPPGLRHGLICTEGITTLDIKFRIHDPDLAAVYTSAAGVAVATDALHVGLGDALRAARGSWAGPRTAACLTHVLWKLASDESVSTAVAPEVAPTATAGAEHPLIRRLLDVIRSDLAGPLSAEDLATGCGYSYRHLAECCHRIIGMSPCQIVLRERLALACQLLRYSDYPVKAVAQRCGFRTVHHFTRRFSLALGSGPAAWRRRAMDSEARRGIVLAPDFDSMGQLTADGWQDATLNELRQSPK